MAKKLLVETGVKNADIQTTEEAAGFLDVFFEIPSSYPLNLPSQPLASIPLGSLMDRFRGGESLRTSVLPYQVSPNQRES